jgi:hypothetical protein
MAHLFHCKSFFFFFFLKMTKPDIIRWFGFILVENNFSSIVAKRLGFLPTTHKLTPHIKAKKIHKKKTKKKITPYSS